MYGTEPDKVLEIIVITSIMQIKESIDLSGGNQEMWKDRLQEIVIANDQYGKSINDGATDEEIELFALVVKNEFQIKLPDAYTKFLAVVNGIEYNGFILYGIDQELSDKQPNQPINGFVACNKVWYENKWQKKYIFLGESSISWYVYDLTSSKYYELDNPSGSETEEFGSFESLAEKVLGDALA